MTKKTDLEKEHKRKDAVELLRLAGVLDDVDDDVAELCIKLMPEGKDKLISMAELMSGVQDIKKGFADNLKKVRDDIIGKLGCVNTSNNTSYTTLIEAKRIIEKEFEECCGGLK